MHSHTDPLSFVQILGYIGSVLFIIGFLSKCDTRMRIVVVLGDFFVFAHFVMLGAHVAAVNTVLGTTRIFLSAFESVRRKAHIFVPLMLLAICVFSFYTYQRPIDIFPFCAGVCATFSLFYFKGVKMRTGLMLGEFFWLMHNVPALSYGPMITDLFCLCAHGITIMRLRRDEHEKSLIERERGDGV